MAGGVVLVVGLGEACTHLAAFLIAVEANMQTCEINSPKTNFSLAIENLVETSLVIYNKMN